MQEIRTQRLNGRGLETDPWRASLKENHMNSFNCELSILVARPDVSFMLHTIPHLVRSCNYSFSRRSLILDHALPRIDFACRPNLGDLSELRDCCDKLLASGIVDKVIDIDYSESRRIQIYNKHFNSDIRDTHDRRGSSIYGHIFSIDEAQADYVVHFDSDMLLYQQSGSSWIDRGIELLQQNSEILVVNPLPGPPTDDGVLYQGEPYQYDPRGFYRFKCFSSRVYLIDKKRFDLLLPLTPEYATDGKPAVWEAMVTANIGQTIYVRADIALRNAWTLHPNDHSTDFVAALLKIIERIEKGWYPAEQAGHYDLKLSAWMQHLGIERKHARVHSIEQIIEEYILTSLQRRSAPTSSSDACVKLRLIGEGGGEWVFDLNHSYPILISKETEAECTITTSVTNLLEMFNGELIPAIAIKYGLLKIDGDVNLFKNINY